MSSGLSHIVAVLSLGSPRRRRPLLCRRDANRAAVPPVTSVCSLSPVLFVHSPSLMAQVVQSMEKHTVEKGVVTSCLCLVSDFSSGDAERGSGIESSGGAVT